MTDFPFRSELLNKNSVGCKKYIQKELTDKNVITVLRDLIFLSVSLKFQDKKAIHPVVIVNIVKNLIGDDRNKPSKVLITFCLEYLLQFNLRNNDEKVLRDAKKKGIGNTAFIGDLEDAYQESKWDKATSKTAISFLSSDNSRGTFDALAELALQDIKRNGLFVFHLMRAYHFQEEKDDNWVFTRCLMSNLMDNNLPDPHKIRKEVPDKIKNKILSNGDIILFSAMERLWQCDYVRIRGYQREISHWCSKEIENNLDNSRFVALRWIFETKKSKFIDYSENLIQRSDISESEKMRSLILVESYRAILKKLNSKQLSILKKRINN